MNARTHCRASNAVGLNTAGSSRPLPHSTLVKVFGPKCTNAFVSIRCHASCAADGSGGTGTGPSAACGEAARIVAQSASLERRDTRPIVAR
jgi:hypothetical protein